MLPAAVGAEATTEPFERLRGPVFLYRRLPGLEPKSARPGCDEPEWFFSVLPPDTGHRELDSRYHRAFRECGYFLAEERGSRLIVSGQLRRLMWRRDVGVGRLGHHHYQRRDF